MTTEDGLDEEDKDDEELHSCGDMNPDKKGDALREMLNSHDLLVNDELTASTLTVAGIVATYHEGLLQSNMDPDDALTLTIAFQSHMQDYGSQGEVE